MYLNFRLTLISIRRINSVKGKILCNDDSWRKVAWGILFYSTLYNSSILFFHLCLIGLKFITCTQFYQAFKMIYGDTNFFKYEYVMIFKQFHSFLYAIAHKYIPIHQRIYDILFVSLITLCHFIFLKPWSSI